MAGAERIPESGRFAAQTVTNHQEHPRGVETIRPLIRVEHVGLADLPSYHRFMNTNLATFPYLSEEGRTNLVREKTLPYYEQAYRDPNRTLLVAKDATGRIIGGIEASFRQVAQQPVAYVHWVVVSEQDRKRGVGKSLYEQYERLARMHGRRYLLTHVHNDNLRSLALHRRVGIRSVYAENQQSNGKYYFKDLHTTSQYLAHAA